MHTSQNNLHTWISAYIQECKVQRQLSPHTVKNYQRQLQVVVKQTKLQAWTDLTPNIAKRVMQQGNKDGLSARTINLRLTVLRNFCRYLVKQKVIKNNLIREKLEKLIQIVNHITTYNKLVFPIHPRTQKSLEKHGLMEHIHNNKAIILTPPLGYLAFQKLIADSKYVITDSGGIQEETTFRQIPCLTLRENTERPVTITLGTNELVPFDIEIIGEKIESIQKGTFKKGAIPPLWDGQATKRIVAAINERVIKHTMV